MSDPQIRSTASTSRITTSNHSDVQKRGTSAFSNALSKISNTVQKWVGTFGLKGHSLQPADKIKIAAIKQEMAETMDNILKGKSDQASKPHNQPRIQRPKEAPPAPPIAAPNQLLKPVRLAPPVPDRANVSKQGPEISAQKESEPVERIITKEDIYKLLISKIPKNTSEKAIQGVGIALANASFEKQYRQQK